VNPERACRNPRPDHVPAPQGFPWGGVIEAVVIAAFAVGFVYFVVWVVVR
jgi:hypothetical protein